MAIDSVQISAALCFGMLLILFFISVIILTHTGINTIAALLNPIHTSAVAGTGFLCREDDMRRGL
jgi:hypothetical protein